MVQDDKELLEKLGRNDLCPCGSGRKFKRCCLRHRSIRRCTQRSLFSGIENTAVGQAVPPVIHYRLRSLWFPRLHRHPYGTGIESGKSDFERANVKSRQRTITQHAITVADRRRPRAAARHWLDLKALMSLIRLSFGTGAERRSRDMFANLASYAPDRTSGTYA